MDVDLSTGLEGFLPLVAPLLSGHSDLAIGSRLHRQAAVVRGAEREFVSRSYTLLLKAGLAARFSDAQCGFKAIRTDVFQALAPHIEDTAWTDDPDSRVDIVRTALDDLRGMGRMLRATATGRTRIAVPRRTSTPQVPAARTTIPAVLPTGANTHLEYAS